MSKRRKQQAEIIAKPGDIYLFTNADGHQTYWLVRAPTDRKWLLTPAIRIATTAVYTAEEAKLYPAVADILIDGDEWTHVA